MILKFVSLFGIIVLGIMWLVILWRENDPGWRLFNACMGMVVLGPFPLALVWAVNYGYLSPQGSGWAMLLPVFILVIVIVSFIGDTLNL